MGNICKNYKIYRKNRIIRDYEEKDCPICLTAKLESNKFTLKKCGHEFHKKCLERWVTISPVCPICRSNIYDPQLFKNKPKEEEIIFY